MKTGTLNSLVYKAVMSIKVLLLVSLASFAQIPQPHILTLEPRHGSGIDQILNHVIPTNDGGFITTISTSSKTGDFQNVCLGQTNRYKIIFTKYNQSSLNIEWEKCYSNEGDSGYAYIYPQKDKTFTLAGATGSSLGRDFLLRKEDDQKNILWGKRYGGSAGEILRACIQTEDGGFLAALETNSNDGDVGLHYGSVFSLDTWVIKLDSNGNKEWSVVLGGTGDDIPLAVVPANNAGYFVISTTSSTDYDCVSNHGKTDVLVAYLDTSGNKIWTRCYGGPEHDASWAGSNSYGAAISDGNYGAYITVPSTSDKGDVKGHVGYRDFWFFQIDTSGNILLNSCYGSTDGQEASYAICKATDGSIWIGGVSRWATSGQITEAYGEKDAVLIHIKEDGTFLSTKVFGSSEDDEINMLYPLANNTVFVGGQYMAKGGTAPDTFADDFSGGIDVFIATVAPWTTDVNELNESFTDIEVYPNPTAKTLNIIVPGNYDIRSISVYSMDGRRLYNSKNIPVNGINVNGWASGVYYLKVQSLHKDYYQKFVVQ